MLDIPVGITHDDMTKKARPTSTKAATNEKPLNATFPALSHKHNIPCRVLLEDQILVLDVGLDHPRSSASYDLTVFML